MNRDATRLAALLLGVLTLAVASGARAQSPARRDAQGREVALPRPARRIVSLAPSASRRRSSRSALRTWSSASRRAAITRSRPNSSPGWGSSTPRISSGGAGGRAGHRPVRRVRPPRGSRASNAPGYRASSCREHGGRRDGLDPRPRTIAGRPAAARRSRPGSRPRCGRSAPGSRVPRPPAPRLCRGRRAAGTLRRRPGSFMDTVVGSPAAAMSSPTGPRPTSPSPGGGDRPGPDVVLVDYPFQYKVGSPSAPGGTRWPRCAADGSTTDGLRHHRLQPPRAEDRPALREIATLLHPDLFRAR